MSTINLKFLYALCYLTVKYAYKLLAKTVHNAKNNSFKENQKPPNSETLDNRTRNIPQTLIPFTKFTQCLRGQLSLAARQQGRARHAAAWQVLVTAEYKAPSQVEFIVPFRPRHAAQGGA